MFQDLQNIQIDWSLSDTYVSSSNIHGLGHFTKKHIPKNTIVVVFGGIPFKKEDAKVFKRGSQEEWLFYASNLPISNGFMIGHPSFFIKRPINHSCDPNLVIEGQIVTRAYRDISPDEELCLDYGTITDDAQRYTIIEKCLCKTRCCRKQITSYDWKESALQEKYGSHFSISLLKKMGKI